MALIYSLGGLAYAMATHVEVSRGQKTAHGSLFSPSTVWVLKIKLRLLGSLASTFTQGTIFPSHPPFNTVTHGSHDLGNSQGQTWSNVIGNRSWGSVVIHTLKESSVVSVTINVSSNSSMNSRPR